ncbi:hypothetical protein [Candidatus Jettenia sp. AMX1]|nr:hypothetical protein [Candidatus Jettenia sp. AMX1]WKZ14192.1 MAG: hypothetical protein QY317_09755 [Candidatus Jettenia caeni]
MTNTLELLIVNYLDAYGNAVRERVDIVIRQSGFTMLQGIA